MPSCNCDIVHGAEAGERKWGDDGQGKALQAREWCCMTHRCQIVCYTWAALPQLVAASRVRSEAVGVKSLPCPFCNRSLRDSTRPLRSWHRYRPYSPLSRSTALQLQDLA